MRKWTMMLAALLALAMCACTAMAAPVDSRELSIDNQWSETEKIDGENQVYYYHIAVPEEGHLTLRLQSWMYGVNYRFWDASLERNYDRDSLWNGSEAEPINSVMTDRYLPAGDYYAEVLAQSGCFGDFRLVALFTPGECNVPEPNQPANKAVPLGAGQTARGMLCGEDQYDYFHFSIAERQTVKFTVKAYMRAVTFGLRDGNELQVVDAEGQNVDDDSIWDGTENEPRAFVTERELMPGDYLIMLRYLNNEGVYELTAQGEFTNAGFEENPKPLSLENVFVPVPETQPQDAAPGDAKTWFCPNCGTKNNGNFCYNCGTPNPRNAGE